MPRQNTMTYPAACFRDLFFFLSKNHGDMAHNSHNNTVSADEEEHLECKNSKQCAPAKHHFDECVERVTNAPDDDGGEKEDCVEECEFCPYQPTPHGLLELEIGCIIAAFATCFMESQKWTRVLIRRRFFAVFHLAHCATQCAAPKLWSILK